MTAAQSQEHNIACEGQGVALDIALKDNYGDTFMAERVDNKVVLTMTWTSMPEATRKFSCMGTKSRTGYHNIQMEKEILVEIVMFLKIQMVI